ncbi:UNVERIFIED_CONTAM: hypothetical protein K2H54_030827 [Gekko kuhli]
MEVKQRNMDIFYAERHRRGYAQQEQQQLLRPALLRPEELSMESGIDPGQEYYGQDYYSYEHGYELPQYGSRRRLLSPSGMYDEYGEVVVEGDGGFYYSPQGPEAERRRPGPLVAGRGISRRPVPRVAVSAVGERKAVTEGTARGRRKLKAVMQLSRVAISTHKPVAAVEVAPSPWKKAKIFPMLHKVRGKDADYNKLMAARQADGEDSMVIKGSYFQKSAEDKPLPKKPGRALKRPSVSKKPRDRTSEELSESESKSGISISVTAESESEESDYGKKRKRRRKSSSSSEESSASASSESQSDKDYLKVTLDQDETNESTVDSDEESEDSESSGSSSGSESEETSDRSEESGSHSKVSDTEEESKSKISSVLSSKSSEVSSMPPVQDKSSEASSKKPSSTTGSELDDAVQEVAEEEEESSSVMDEEETDETETSSTIGKSRSDRGTTTTTTASESEIPTDSTSF